MLSSPLYCAFCRQTFNVYEKWQSHMLDHMIRDIPPQIRDIPPDIRDILPQILEVVIEKGNPLKMMVYIVRELKSGRIDSIWVSKEKAAVRCETLRQGDKRAVDIHGENLPVAPVLIERDWVVKEFSAEWMPTEEKEAEVFDTVRVARQREAAPPIPAELPGLQDLAIKITEIAIAHNKMMSQVIENYFTTRELLLRRLTQTEGAPEQAGNLGEK